MLFKRIDNTELAGNATIAVRHHQVVAALQRMLRALGP